MCNTYLFMLILIFVLRFFIINELHKNGLMNIHFANWFFILFGQFCDSGSLSRSSTSTTYHNGAGSRILLVLWLDNRVAVEWWGHPSPSGKNVHSIIYWWDPTSHRAVNPLYFNRILSNVVHLYNIIIIVIIKLL